MNNAQCEMMVLFIHVAHQKAGLNAKGTQISYCAIVMRQASHFRCPAKASRKDRTITKG